MSAKLTWAAVYQQAQRRLAAGCFDALADDLHAVLRLTAGRRAEPSAAILDSRTLRSTLESGVRFGYDGVKRKQGSRLRMAVDTLGHLLALHVTAVSTDERADVGRPTVAVQEAAGDSVSLAYVEQGCTGERAAEAARAHGIALEVVKLPGAKNDFVLMPGTGRWSGPSPGPCGSGA